MSGTYKLPVIGPTKKSYVYGAGGLVVVIVGYAYWRAGRGGGGEAAELPGEEVPGEDYTSDSDPGAGGDYTGAVGGGGLSSNTTGPGEVITNNAQWSLAAIGALSDVGVDTLTASASIGRFLARQEVTAAQGDIIRQALAMVGDPPTGVYEIRVSTGTTDTPTTPTTPTGHPGASLAAPTGLATWGNGPSRLTVPLKWEPVSGAVGYRVYRADVATNIGASADTQITVGGLLAGKSYTFHVRAIGTDQKYGPKSSSITLKTKK